MRGGQGSYLVHPAHLSPAPSPPRKQTPPMSHFSGRDVLVQPPSTQKEHPKPRPVAGGKGETLPYNPLLRYGHRLPPRQTRTHQQLPSLVANVGLPPRCTPRAQHATSSPERASSSGKTSETAPCTHGPCSPPRPILSPGPHRPSPTPSNGQGRDSGPRAGWAGASGSASHRHRTRVRSVRWGHRGPVSWLAVPAGARAPSRGRWL